MCTSRRGTRVASQGLVARLALLAPLFLAACQTGTFQGGEPAVDAAPAPSGADAAGPPPGTDAGSNARSDAGPAPTDCVVPATYATIPGGGQSATERSIPGSTGSHYLTFDVALDVAAPHDSFVLQLWDGYGAFSGGSYHAGTYTIAGAEADAVTCGVCAYLYGDVDAAGKPTQEYFAQGGTVTVTSVSGTMSGSVSNLTFVQ